MSRPATRTVHNITTGRFMLDGRVLKPGQHRRTQATPAVRELLAAGALAYVSPPRKPAEPAADTPPPADPTPSPAGVPNTNETPAKEG